MISYRFPVYNFIRRVEWDILGEPMRRNVSYISHEGISGGREHDSGYVPTKELFRTRGVHRKSHQCAIKSACVATRRRIVLTLRLSRLFRSFRKGCRARYAHVETRKAYRKQSPRLHLHFKTFLLFISIVSMYWIEIKVHTDWRKILQNSSSCRNFVKNERNENLLLKSGSVDNHCDISVKVCH